MNDNSHNQTSQLKLHLVENILFLYEFYTIPKLLQHIIYFFGNFQYVTFLQLPIYQENQHLWFQTFNYQEFFIYISRFDIALNHQFKLKDEQYLISLIVFLLFIILPYLALNFIKKKSIIYQSSFVNEFFKISSFIIQIFSNFLFTPLILFIINSISHFKQQYELSNQGLHIFFATVSILGILIIQIILFSISLKTFDFKLNAFNQLNISLLDYLQEFLLIIQLLSYCLINNLKYGLIVQSTIIIILSFLKIIRVFELFTCRVLQLKILIFISSFGLVYGMTNLILLFQDDYERIINVITLLLLLIINSILQKEFNDQEISLLLKIVKDNKKSSIKYYFAKIINHEFQTNQICFMNCLIQQKYDIYNQEQSSNQIEILNQEIELQFFYKKIKALCQIINSEKELDIDYVAILYHLKFYNLAYKQIMIAQNLNRIQKNIQSSEINKNDAEFRQQNFNQPKFSVRSMSKSGKSNSEDLNNQIQKKVLKSNKLLVSVREKVSVIMMAQLNFLKCLIRKEMLQQYSIQNNRKSKFAEIQLGIQLYLKNEKRNNNLRLKIIRLLQDKNAFYIQFVNKKLLDHQKLFDSAKKISSLIFALEKKLINRYEKYPSHKVQSALIYFQAEVQNNFIEAYRLKSLTSISDQQLIEIDQNLQVQLFSKEVVHINVAQLEDQGDLIILNCSKNTQKFLQLSDQDYRNFSTITQILPSFIVDEHNLLVNKFIQKGESKYYLQYHPSFFKITQNLVKCCDLLFDFHFDDIYTFKFSIFLQNASTVQAFMFLNINEQIGGFTEQFFEKLKFNGKAINILDEFDFKMINITQLMPEYLQIVKEKKTIIQTEFRFIKQEMLIQHYKKNNNIRSLVTLWADCKNLNQFYVDIAITYCSIWEFNYILIELKDIHVRQGQDFVYTLQVTKSRDEFDKAISLSSEALANDANYFTKNRLFNNSENYQTEENDQQIEEIKNIEPKQQFYDMNILSPNSSQIGLNELSLQQKMIQQQDFFNSHLADNSYSLQRSIEQIQNIQKKDDQEEFIDQQVKKNTTLTSKQTGIQRSQFYKKYELVQDNNFTQVPSSFGKVFLFLSTSLGISFIFYVIVIVLVGQDLNRFIAEIDMIQLHSGVMVPHDFYFQMRFSIFTYTGYKNKGVITQEKFNNLTNLLYENMYVGYEEFKGGFVNQLNNQYLQVFYNDKNVTVYYMYEFGLNTYPVTYNVREVFFTFLTYYYEFLLRFQARLSPANQTYQVFQFANAYKLHFILEGLAQDAWKYSINRSVVIKDKWNEIWIIFLILSFVPIIFSMFYLRKYKQVQDKYLNLFRYFSQIKVQREIEKNKQQIKLLKQNPDYVYYYKFDYEILEEQLLMEKNIIEKEQLKYKESKYLPQFKQLSIKYFIIIIFGTWLIFFLFSFFNNQQVQGYLNKYPASCDLYKLLQNMSLSTGSLSRNKEFKLTFPSLPFMREDDTVKFYQTIEYALDDAANFLKLCLNFNPDLYYSSEGFMDFFDQIQGHDICSVLSENDLGFLMYYCDISLNGNIRLGLLPTIKYLVNIIKLEQPINNFTKRVEYSFLEMEGGLIIMRVFQKMIKTFKEGMVTVTQDQINTSNALSISYVILNIILMIWFIFILPSMMLKELIYVKRFIVVVPRTVLFLDDQLERHVRMIGVNEKY